MPLKIVSLSPAATEIICALGLKQNLAGRSQQCDFPDWVKQLPVCSETTIQEDIETLTPDFVIAEAHSNFSLNYLQDTLENLPGKQPQLIEWSANDLEAVFSGIDTIAKALDVSAAGDTLNEELQDRVNIIRHKLKFVENKPTLALIEWLDSLTISGNWTPELTGIAGATPVLTTAAKEPVIIDWNDLLLTDPDIIVVALRDCSVEQTLKEIDNLFQLPSFHDLKAIKNNRFYIADGKQYFSYPGPRMVDTLEILAEIINPKQFIFGYEGNGWIRFSV